MSALALRRIVARSRRPPAGATAPGGWLELPAPTAGRQESTGFPASLVAEGGRTPRTATASAEYAPGTVREVPAFAEAPALAPRAPQLGSVATPVPPVVPLAPAEPPPAPGWTALATRDDPLATGTTGPSRPRPTKSAAELPAPPVAAAVDAAPAPPVAADRLVRPVEPAAAPSAPHVITPRADDAPARVGPERPPTALPATTPAHAATAGAPAAPSVVIDRIEIVTPPTRPAPADPLASLHDARLGAARHARSRG